MPLLAEIANSNPYFQYNSFSLRAQMPSHDKVASISFTFGNEQRLPCAWKSLDKLKKVNFNVGRLELRRGRLLIKAVATLEPKRLAANEDKCMSFKDSEMGRNSNLPVVRHESCDEEPEELDEREKMRRMRISKANTGNTPWNKGRKHSAETIQKIRERTRLAMQNPKVKMKLVDLGHAQTTETRLKIGIGVKKGWERRREKKMVQEACHFEWKNLIAEASRQGFVGEKELQWNSYETMDEQLQQEWLESVEQRKKMQRSPVSKRAPKSPEQRRKIAEAISGKWADPEYRQRVCSAMAKYHGTQAGAERKPRRRPTDGTQSTRSNPIKKKATDTSILVKSDDRILTHKQLKRSKYPVYRDPLASSKLEMIKNIRALRAAEENKQAEAIERARLLIAEAEKAGKALEVAATKSPIAHASLIETRKLIAEAIQSLESIETQHITESNVSSSVSLSEIDREKSEASDHTDMGQVNGHKALASIDYKFSDGFGKISLHKSLNGDPKLHLSTNNDVASSAFGFEMESDSTNQPAETQRDQNMEYKTDPSPMVVGIQSLNDETSSGSHTVTKKWVRGRLVEVVDEAQ